MGVLGGNSLDPTHKKLFNFYHLKRVNNFTCYTVNSSVYVSDLTNQENKIILRSRVNRNTWTGLLIINCAVVIVVQLSILYVGCHEKGVNPPPPPPPWLFPTLIGQEWVFLVTIENTVAVMVVL